MDTLKKTSEEIWYTQSIADIVRKLETTDGGLEESEAKRRLATYGQNALPEGKTESGAIIFVRQFKSPLIYLLLAAAGVMIFVGEASDAVVIGAVLLLNSIIGAVQEGKAQNTLLALKHFSETTAAVFRGGKEIIIPDREIVPGDIIALSAGEKVPADARVITARNLTADEAALTGESQPVHKTSEMLFAKSLLPSADQKNILFKGTNISAGNGRAVVFATGAQTALGKIAQGITSISREETPLQKDIAVLSRFIIFAVAGVCVLLFAIGLARGEGVREIFLIAVSLSVSLIPEGLPIVVTLILATGVWRMSQRKVLVKKLQAVQSLGQVKILAVDKTGTMTKNEMTLQKIYLAGSKKLFEAGGAGYEPTGDIFFGGNIIDPHREPELFHAGEIAALCADAVVAFSPEKNEWRVSGDPTEAAMLVFSQKLGIKKDELENAFPLIAEIPFDYRTKFHATLHANTLVKGEKILTVVGAPEVLLTLSALSPEEKENISQNIAALSGEGLRVVAFAEGKFTEKKEDGADAFSLDPEHIRDLSFLGLFGMKDALRPEAREAVERVTAAGIRMVMITGDHALTAMAIAREAGIYREGDTVLTGEEIDTLSPQELSARLERTSVFARVSPDQKLKIVDAYKLRGSTIAMTGDGVNDAPSLVAADLGVAMGKIGTEVAKEAADIVLLDDNFGGIVAAAEEGRNIFATIKKVVLYLFSTGIGEALAILGALIIGLPLPLLATQIIWLNFVTDGFLTIALALEPKDANLLRGSGKQPPKRYFIDTLSVQRMFVMGLPMAIGTLWLFASSLGENAGMEKAWTIALTTLALFQWFNAFNCRSENQSVFRMNPFSNLALIASLVAVIVAQMLAIYHPFFQSFLHTAPLSLSEWLAIIPVSLTIILAEEVRKFFTQK